MDKMNYKDFEEKGVDVLAVDEEGKVAYKTESDSKECICSSCSECRILPDPDPYDWFDDDDVKIVCKASGKVIANCLRPYEAKKFNPGSKCPNRKENS